MPTYEKVVDGIVVERSVVFAGTEHDVQLSHAASTTDSPWHLVDANGERVKPDPMPVFTEPSEVDTSVDTPQADPALAEAPAQVDEVAPADTAPDTNEAEPEPAVTDQPDESGDHTEE